MKQILTAVFLFATILVNAQSDKFKAAMEKNLAMFSTSKSTADYQALATSFERIGDAEKTEWLPYYYAALALLTPAWTDQNVDKDANSEKVKAIVAKADPLVKENADKAEIETLRNMTATQQMLVDPQNRWMTYGQEGAAALKKAKELDPSNPRVAYLEGTGIFGTPEQFGGGKAKAKPILENAVALYNSAKPKPLHPDWGKQQAEEMLAKCQ